MLRNRKALKTRKGVKLPNNQPTGAKDKAPAAVALTRAYLGDSALVSLVGETVALFHRLRVVTEQIHEWGEMTSGKRGILASLDRSGPQTVPQMARARPVSRQYIQSLVNELIEEDYVEFQENPAHKKSSLVLLTPKGKEFFDSMVQKEVKLWSRLKLDIPEKDLHAAASVLRSVRELFESKQWKRVL
jgi:DNA-binding MarR family transcriptional regulator